MLIIYFFQMVLNTCEMWSNGIKIAFFSKKFQKNRSATRGFVPRSPSVIRLNKLVYLHISPTLHIFICNFWFKPSLFRKLSVWCQTRPRLLIFHSTISLSHKNSSFENFWWLYCIWFLVCPPPNQKSWLRLCTRDGISSRVPPNHCLSSPSESKLL